MTSILDAATPVDLGRLTDEQLAAALERIAAEQDRRHAARELDPDLWYALRRRCDELEQRNPHLASEIRRLLDEISPKVVAAEYWRELVPDRPALGHYLRAFPRRDLLTAPSADDWLRADPRRLAGVVVEMRRFSNDLPGIVRAVLALADGAGIDAELADRIVCAALREAEVRDVAH